MCGAHVFDPHRRAKFLACDGALKAFQAIVNSRLPRRPERCENGYLLMEDLHPFRTESLFNCFDSNLAKNTMSEIHKKSKKTSKEASQEEKRHRETRKRQKLCSNKEHHSTIINRQYNYKKKNAQ